jgi:hypothetical protein
MVAAMLERWIVDEPVSARARIEALASEFAVDEVMVHPVAGAFTDTAPQAAPAREQTLRSLVVP